MEARDQAILEIIVEAFLAGAQTVSSAEVAGRLDGFEVSSATVRATMAELENQGLLFQPHLSSGRVPTEKGLRAFLDGLKPARLPNRDRQRLSAAAADTDISHIPIHLGQSLSEMSGQLAIVAVSRQAHFREVALVRHDERHFFVFFVSPGGLVEHKLVGVDFDLDPSQLIEAQNYLNLKLESLSLTELRSLIKAELNNQHLELDNIQARVLEIGAQALRAKSMQPELELFIDGASQLVGQPEFADHEKLRSLLRNIERRTVLLELIDRILDNTGVQVMLGSEHQIKELLEVVCVGDAWCAAEGQTVAVTLLGPTRMNYGRLVPLVGFTTQLLRRLWCHA